MSTALVTGATSGIGLGFANRLAQLGHDLVLVARDEAALTAIARRLQTGRAAVEVLVADLATDGGCAAVEARLADVERPVDILVNNAGFGVGASFLDSPIETEEALLRVLVRAPMRLSHAGLPGMVARGRGAILNVSSMAGVAPMNSYGAAKAWLTAFTQALDVELAGTAVRAIAVLPGFTHTKFHARAGIDETRIPRWLWLSVDQVVRDALRDARRGRVVSIPSRRYRLLALGAALTPSAISARVVRATKSGRLV